MLTEEREHNPRMVKGVFGFVGSVLSLPLSSSHSHDNCFAGTVDAPLCLIPFKVCQVFLTSPSFAYKHVPFKLLTFPICLTNTTLHKFKCSFKSHFFNQSKTNSTKGKSNWIQLRRFSSFLVKIFAKFLSCLL